MSNNESDWIRITEASQILRRDSDWIEQMISYQEKYRIARQELRRLKGWSPADHDKNGENNRYGLFSYKAINHEWLVLREDAEYLEKQWYTPAEVYILIDPIYGHVFYVGKSKDTERRYAEHLSKARQILSSTGRSLGSIKHIYIARMIWYHNVVPVLAVVDTALEINISARERYWIERFIELDHPVVANEYDPDGYYNKFVYLYRSWRVPLPYPRKPKTKYTRKEWKELIKPTQAALERAIAENNKQLEKAMLARIKKYRLY